ncbi:DUF333 domain-containing protein [Enterobacteriaceae bacterium LUAb1]
MRAIILFLCTAILSACSSDEPQQKATSAHIPLPMNMSEQAYDVCQHAGGKLTLSRQLDGSTIGMCQLENGRRCSETALISGGCLR